MYRNLEMYLEDVGHYLVLRHGADDVLAEIRSHILEKASQEHGVVSEQTIAHVISGYGSPQHVAARYVEEETLIAPTLKKYLIRYTTIVFVIHAALTLVASLLKTSLVIFPFLYIPQLSSVAGLFYLPTAFIYDLGLVGIFLYFVTRRAKDMRLPWFNIRIQPSEPTETGEEPRLYLLILMLAGFGAVLWVYVRFQTLFIFGVGPDGPLPLFSPAVSHWYSLAVLALVAVGIGGYAARFYTRSEWIDVATSAAGLMIAGIVNVYPLEEAPSRLPFLSERTFGTAFVLVVAVTNAIGLLSGLFRAARRMLTGLGGAAK